MYYFIFIEGWYSPELKVDNFLNIVFTSSYMESEISKLLKSFPKTILKQKINFQKM